MKSGMMTACLLAVAAIGSAGAAEQVSPPAPVRSVSVPFTIDQIFGSRPVVEATIASRPFRLVLHANAGSYLQINHAEAKSLGAHDLIHRGAYGIAAPGKISDLGRDDGIVDGLAVGTWTAARVPVAVFEVPSGGSQGMLGLPFLHDNNVVLDFARNRATLSQAPSTDIVAAMAARGYAPHPMTRDTVDGRYLIAVTINGVAAPMVVSTVASIDLDSEYCKRASVSIGPVSGSYGGPSGATGHVYEAAQPIVIRIGNWASKPAKVQVEDTYAYSKTPRPADATQTRGGDLGADFMIANRAVIDFGNAVLYLPR